MIEAYLGAVSRITSKRNEVYYKVNIKAAIRVLQLRFNVASIYAVLKIRQKNMTFGKEKNCWKYRANLMFNGCGTRQRHVG